MPSTTLYAAPTHWERVAATRWGRYLTERQREALLYALRAGPTGTSLDVGCDGGRWSMLAQDHGWELVCTDADPERLAVCRSRLPKARCVQVSVADETLPVETGEVQLVIVYEIPQVVEAAWFVREAARVLPAGGRLVCSYWNPFSLRGAAYRLLHKLRAGRSTDGVPRFLNFYAGPAYYSFRRVLRDHGFEVVREEGICWFPFTRDSDSRLVPPAVAAEAALGLRHVPSLSPWVLFVAVKRGEAAQPAP